MTCLYPHLLSPVKIRGKLFKNRILGGPLGYNQKNLSAAMSQDNIDFFGALARGGAARITTGDCMVSENAGYGPGNGGRPHFYADPSEIHSSIKTYVHTIHRYGCLAFVQLAHNGAGNHPKFDVVKPDDPYEQAEIIGENLNKYTKEDFRRIIGEYVRCAHNLKEGGIDGIIIHGGHAAKLIDQLRSPLTNHRTDEYGGSLENRCRFILELMRALRTEVGPDILLEFRFSGREYVDGGIEIGETIECLKMLEAEHTVDIFHLSGGMHVAPLSNAYTTSCGMFPHAVFREEARAIREAGIKTPLAIVNSMGDPDICEEMLANNEIDFAVMSRQINLADPYFPRKLREGKPWLIDNCLRCHGCYDVDGPCSVNPYASYKTYESSYELPPAKTPRKVCVVGGGIGGLKAAFTAAERGHHVILFEKDAVLGGQLRFSDTDMYKVDIRRYKNNMIRRCMEHPNIEIRLNTKVTPESIKAEMPCALIVAIGAVQKKPTIPGADAANVLTVMQSYLEPEKIGSKVIMLGSGLTACEVGLHLERCGKKVTVIGRREHICFKEQFNHPPTAVFSPVPIYMKWFDEKGIDLYNDSEVVEIYAGGVKICNVKTGAEQIVEGDTVIVAAGVTARQEEALSFNDCGADYFSMVGDCLEPHKIREAVSTAFWAAYEA